MNKDSFVRGVSVSRTVQIYGAEPGTLYNLDAVARLTGVPRRTILVYCNSGLVEPVQSEDSGAWHFDDAGIHRIRDIDFLRRQHGINLTGLKMIYELTREVERLREELRFFQR